MNPQTLLSDLEFKLDVFVGDKLDDDTLTFTFKEASDLASDAGVHVAVVIAKLQELGLDYAGREVPKKVRGFQTSSNDRWFGPGSSPTSGGSGWEQIAGFAGQEG